MQLSDKVWCKYALHHTGNTILMISTGQDVLIFHQYGVTGKVLSLNSKILSLRIEPVVTPGGGFLETSPAQSKSQNCLYHP